MRGDFYLLELVPYIHLNPLRAKLVGDYEELCRYPYGGHSVILGRGRREWQDAEYVLRLFAQARATARRRYLQFMKEGIAQGKRPDLVGGGLLRSQGGVASDFNGSATKGEKGLMEANR